MKRSKTKKNAISRGTFFSSASFLVFVICIFSLFLSPCSVWAVNATLTWNANTEDDLAGYRIFYRAEGQSYNYDTPAWEGMAETCIISDLDDNTTYYFVVRAFDTSGNESTDSAEACYLPNRPPVLNAIGTKSVNENESLVFTISASDPDTDTLTYTAGNLPTGASFNAAAQQFSWTPGYGAAGNYTVIFTVTDNGSPIKSDSEEITITVGNVNRPPVLNTIGAKTVDENELLEFTISASDLDGDALTYTVSNLPTGASFNAAQQKFSWTPGYGAAGNYTVTFTATDNGTPAQSDSETVTITVGDVNRPPVLNAIGAKTVDENELLEFTITASDPDADTLIYTAGGLPTGASFNAAQQRFSWTPGYGAAGNYTVTFTATDNGAPTQSDSETITITVGDVNRPPVLNAIGAKTVNENELLEFTITASDPDADTLTYTASNLPTGASFDDAQQKFSWTPGDGAAGNYTVTFTVTDDGAPTQNDSETITINVEIPEDNVPPAPPVNVHVHIE